MKTVNLYSAAFTWQNPNDLKDIQSSIVMFEGGKNWSVDAVKAVALSIFPEQGLSVPEDKILITFVYSSALVSVGNPL